MNLNYKIAARYLFGKKSTNAINLITWISLLGISLGTAALILVLSVFNGFEGLISGLLNNFNPDIKVEIKEGKHFEIDDGVLTTLKSISQVKNVSKALEEIALFEYHGTQEVGVIKGVDEYFKDVTRIDSTIRYGEFILKGDDIDYSVLGTGLSSKLGINHGDALTPVKVYMPLRKKKGPLAKDFKTMFTYPSGVFSVQSDNDFQYMITSYDFASRLLDSKSKLSSLEIDIEDDADIDKVKAEIEKIMGDDFIVKNRYQQDESYLKLMNIEKWVSYLIMTLIILLVAFNLIGALWMIVLDKKLDVAILRSMGFTKERVKNLFILEGLMISGLGLVLGIVIAIVLYWAQRNFGIISVPDGFIIDAYPIHLKWTDILIVAMTVMVLGYLASILPAFRAAKIPTYVRRE